MKVEKQTLQAKRTQTQRWPNAIRSERPAQRNKLLDATYHNANRKQATVPTTSCRASQGSGGAQVLIQCPGGARRAEHGVTNNHPGGAVFGTAYTKFGVPYNHRR